ncbi:Uncharacterised protein [Vibrio cholerae]|nr:Uncharacterised protein [Vibrio cholerae]CSC46978.1 Uncharacterised protein [Vibrio cholerae]CSE06385.1 Uncharacterised protein [Vibrio cholerae]CSI80135.1 Uncharacterised protein [Vibrio cholerae]
MTRSTTNDRAMLKVKNKSSRKAGIGRTTIANAANTMTGAPIAGMLRCGIEGNLSANGIVNFINFWLSLKG